MNKERGITLMTLVITIIVMLILVSVSVTMAIKGGLFKHAGDAAVQTQNEIDAEKGMANLENGLKPNELIDIYTHNNND